jgi:hypothetical protein
MSDGDASCNHERHGSFGAVILIFLGIVFLLNNLNILSWTIWLSLWRLWLVILILAGLQAVFKGSKMADLIYLLGLIISIGLIYLAITFSNGQLKSEMNRYIPGNLSLPNFQNWQWRGH